MFGGKQRARDAADQAVRTYDALIREYAPKARRYVEEQRFTLHLDLNLLPNELESLDLALMGAFTYRAAWEDLPQRLQAALGPSANLIDDAVVKSLHGITQTALAAVFPGIDLRAVEACLRDSKYKRVDRDLIYYS